MKIEIQDRAVAFFHEPAGEFLVPGTSSKLKVFPCAFIVTDLLSGEEKRFYFELQGPVDPFTVEQNIEKQTVSIYGQSAQGYFRLVIKKKEHALVCAIEKTPNGLLTWLVEDKKISLKEGENLALSSIAVESCPSVKERLFLGNSKQKDMNRVRKNKDLTLVLPLWFALGQTAPVCDEKGEGPIYDLFQALQEDIREQKKNGLEEKFTALYLAGFSAGLVPRKEDEECQGILPYKAETFPIFFSLLSKGADLIRALFFQKQGDRWCFLPCLPHSFISGRISLHIEADAEVRIEWTKKEVRRISILAQEDREVVLAFPKQIKSFRVRKGGKDKGRILNNQEKLSIKKGMAILIDCFSK